MSPYLCLYINIFQLKQLYCSIDLLFIHRDILNNQIGIFARILERLSVCGILSTCQVCFSLSLYTYPYSVLTGVLTAIGRGRRTNGVTTIIIKSL